MAIIMRIEDIGKDVTALAIEKLDSEDKTFKGDKYGNVVHKYVADVLKKFCQEDERFAYVVYKTKRTLSDCVAEIMKGCGNSISDFDVYKKAVKFYFPNSDLECVMTITINGAEPSEEYLNKEAPKTKEKASANKKNEKTSAKAETPKSTNKKKVDKKQTDVIQLTLF